MRYTYKNQVADHIVANVSKCIVGCIAPATYTHMSSQSPENAVVQRADV